MAGEQRHRAWSKGRCHGSSLVLPILALAEQQAVAEQRPQHADRAASPVISRFILDEDVVYTLETIENDLLAAEKATDDNVVLKGLRWKRQERVLAKHLGDNATRLKAGRRPRSGANQRLRFGHLAYPVLEIRCNKDRDALAAFQRRVMSTFAAVGRRSLSASIETRINAPITSQASLKAATSPARSTSGVISARVASSTAPIGTPVKRSGGSPTRRADDASPACSRATMASTCARKPHS